MRRYNILQPIWLAFFSKSLYRDVRENWRGITFAYLFLLAAICSLPIAYHLDNRITNAIFSQEMYAWFKQFPTVTIHQGQASINEPVPYYIKDFDAKDVIAIIDTSDSITMLEGSTAKLLLNSKQLLIKEKEQKVKTYHLTTVKDGSYNVVNYIDNFKHYLHFALIFLLYPCLVLLLFILGLLEAVIYAALAKLFIKTTLFYDALLRLAIIAITPQLFLIAILSLFSISIPYSLIIYFALGMGYLFFAIEANRQEKTAV